jgi:hypothetical protein
MDDITREEILSLVEYGYRNRQGLSKEVAAWQAERLLQQFERAWTCPRCGAEVNDCNPLQGTLWEARGGNELTDAEFMALDVVKLVYGSTG